MLDMERAQRISRVSGGRKVVVYASGKYMSQRVLTEMGITFCQLPYALHTG